MIINGRLYTLTEEEIRELRFQYTGYNGPFMQAIEARTGLDYNDVKKLVCFYMKERGLEAPIS